MSDKVILVGAGGHARVIADIVVKSGNQLLGFLDDDPDKCSVMGYPVLGRIADWRKFSQQAQFLLAVGNARLRQTLAEQMLVRWYTAIHPSAQIGLGVTIGGGTAVMANAVINPGAVIGEHCIINTAAVVEHDSQIADFVHVSVGVRLGGTVRVGRASWIGIGAVVKNNTSICENCMVGAGCVVVKDLDRPGTYIGVPARSIKH